MALYGRLPALIKRCGGRLYFCEIDSVFRFVSLSQQIKTSNNSTDDSTGFIIAISNFENVASPLQHRVLYRFFNHSSWIQV